MEFLKNMKNVTDASVLKGISVLWEDENTVALFKPAGIIVHPDGKNEEPTLSDFVLSKWPETKNVGEHLILKDGREIPRPGIVHRLDRETSGVIVVAKNQEAFLNLKKQFQGRSTKKVYRAYVYGWVKKESGMIDMPLGRSKGDFRQYVQPARARGEMREAVTHYTTLASRGEFSYLELMPKTGRTHQIRAHLKAIGHPIVCDRIYAKEKPGGLGFDRVALHARRLTFHSLSGQLIEVEAPFPPDFIEGEKQFLALPERIKAK